MRRGALSSTRFAATDSLSRAARACPYVIASDRTLREIALLRPRDLQELELAHGIGPAKRKKYGAILLAVVSGESATTGRVSNWGVVSVDRYCSLDFRRFFAYARCRHEAGSTSARPARKRGSRTAARDTIRDTTGDSAAGASRRAP